MTNSELDTVFESYFTRGLQYYALVHPKRRSKRREHPVPDWVSYCEQILPIVKVWPEDRSGRIALWPHPNAHQATLAYIPLASEIKAICSYDYAIKHYPEAIL